MSFKLKFKFSFILGFFLCLFCFQCLEQQNFKIAIIGAGIGGASLTHFLPEKNENINITLYEKEKEAGGRDDHFALSPSKTIEMGASFFIDVNKYIKQLGNIYNCSYGESEEKEIMGLWDANSFLHQTSRNKYITLLKMIWRYKLSPFFFFKENSKFVNKFLEIYNDHPFRNYSHFFSIINLPPLVNLTMEEYLNKEGYNKEFINEFVAGICSGIYNQDFKELNAFAGMIALAGANNKAFSFKEGNRKCIQKIISSNKKTKLQSNMQVQSINKENETYVLKIKNQINGEIHLEKYDIVIIAAPIHGFAIEFLKIDHLKKLPYAKTMVFLVAGKINCKYFDKTTENNDCPQILLNINIKASPISDYSRKCQDCYELKNEKTDIIKIQTTKELQDADFKKIFLNENYKILDSKVWDAYPSLYPLKEEEFPEIILDKGLYYVNGMENLASCMEMQIISAKNIVNLIYEDHFTQKIKEQEEKMLDEEKKNEL